MEGNKAPLVSLLVLFYNHEKFVKDTVRGALSQTYSNLEIVFSDDCSTDGTFQAIKDAVQDYEGPHKIILNRNEKNMGLVPHVNKVLLEFANGKYICLNGGDDVSLPDRVLNTMAYFDCCTNLQAVAFSCKIIDGEGKNTGQYSTLKDIVFEKSSIDYLKSYNMVTPGYGLGFRKDIFDFYGKLNDDCQTEDSTIRFRCLLKGKVLYSSKYGILYRQHGNNISAPVRIFNLRTGKIAKQFAQDLEKSKQTLSVNEYLLLKDKINFYIKFRNLSEKIALNQNYIYKIWFFVLRKIHHYRYLWLIKKHVMA